MQHRRLGKLRPIVQSALFSVFTPLSAAACPKARMTGVGVGQLGSDKCKPDSNPLHSRFHARIHTDLLRLMASQSGLGTAVTLSIYAQRGKKQFRTECAAAGAVEKCCILVSVLSVVQQNCVARQ